MENVAFGSEMRKHFSLSPDIYFANHGSWGVSPKVVLQEKIKLLERIENNPDDVFRFQKDRLYREMIEIGAKFVHADPDNVVLVTNATTAVNCVVKSLKLNPGDAILVSTLTYYAVRQACRAACDRAEGSECLTLQIDIPIASEDSFVQRYEDYLSSHPQVKLVIIDYITSATALLLPVKRIIEVCRRHGALVMVDGAHSPGQIPLELEKLGTDFYTGNFHKWCYVPRGCAMLYVAKKHQDWVMPLLSGHKYKKGFFHEFVNPGTIDHSSFFTLKAGLDFYQAVGGYEKIHPYISDLSNRAAEMLAEAWGTYILPGPVSMRAPNMKNIKLPPLDFECNEEGTVALTKQLMYDYKVVICVTLIGGELYLRISSQIYNVMEDYEKLKSAVLSIANK